MRPARRTEGIILAALQISLLWLSLYAICAVLPKKYSERIQTTHPDVNIYCGAVDDHLNENGYIVPGLGDAGDRIFGTK